MSTDALGNVFVSGGFTSPTLILGTYTLTNPSGGSNYKPFLIKYDANGNVIWAATALGGTNSGASSVNADASGNTFLVGQFSGSSIIFGTYTLTNPGGQDIFIVKYDSNGNVLWAKNSIGSSWGDNATSVSTDAGGNAIISGFFSSSTIAFGTYTLTNNGVYNTFVVKYDSNGNVLWAKSAGGTNWDRAYSISTDALGNAFITGYFGSPSLAFGTYTLTNAGQRDAFLAKYDVNGNILWAKSVGGTGDEMGYSVSAYGGDVFISGHLGTSSFTVGTYTVIASGGLSLIHI